MSSKLAATIVAFAALAHCQAAQTPADAAHPQQLARTVSKPDEGVFAIAVGNETLVSTTEKGEPCLKLGCCLRRKGDSGQPKWIEPKRVKASFDFKSGTAVAEHDICRLEAAYVLQGDRLEATLCLNNTSDADMEFNIRLLALKTLLNYWNCEGEWFGTAWGFAAPGCEVGVFVHDDYVGEYRKCYTDKSGFTPLCVKNSGKPVAAGQKIQFKVCLTFAPEGTGNLELFAKDFEEIGRKTPMALQWLDRRAIGTAFIAQADTRWPGNPRGYITGLREKENINTEEGLAAFGKALMAYADRCIVELKDKNAQGVIVWDLEGQEKPHAISYVGDPRKLPQAVPEMDRFADAFMKKFSDAGFRTGLTVRPTEYHEATPGKRDWTQREVADPFALISEKIQYAKKRWGTTLYYLDSNNPKATVLMQKLQEAHPDCLVIPEWSNGEFYRWSAPYSSPNLGQLTTNARDQFARVKWPKAFGIVAVESGLLETKLGIFVDGVAGGDVLLFRCWYPDPVASLVKLVYHEADMRKSLAGRAKKDLPALLADAASSDELTRYAAVRDLAEHTQVDALKAVVGALDHPGIAVRRAALETIKAQGKTASPAVIEKLASLMQDKDPNTKLLRQSIGEALAAQGEAARPAVRALLESGPEEIRLYALRCLAQMGGSDPAGAKVLLGLFGKAELANYRDMREAVILALGRTKVAEALPGLLALLATDEGRDREWVRVAAIIALGDLGDKRAIEPLINEYKHGYSNIQVYEFRWRLYEALTKLTGQ
ncbi:MAG: HEAT repeat domain-containing protein, partial [Planctomycetota bacterium]